MDADISVLLDGASIHLGKMDLNRTSLVSLVDHVLSRSGTSLDQVLSQDQRVVSLIYAGRRIQIASTSGSLTLAEWLGDAGVNVALLANRPLILHCHLSTPQPRPADLSAISPQDVHLIKNLRAVLVASAAGLIVFAIWDSLIGNLLQQGGDFHTPVKILLLILAGLLLISSSIFSGAPHRHQE